jgi:hypothetical protein
MKQHGQENKRPEKICALTCILALAAILVFTATAAHAQYRVGDFTKGSVSLGFDNRTCDGTLEGALRYNSSTSCAEYCDGADWTCPANGGGGGANFDGPADCPNIGDQCNDNTIYAGYHPTLHVRLFAHPNNQSASSQWSTESVDNLGSRSADDGEVNHNWIVANRTITNYPAFKLCDDFNQSSELGHADWYLPSRAELYYLWLVQSNIAAGPGDAFVIDYYWSSTENGSTSAFRVTFNNGNQIATNKSSYNVRCIRRD